MKPYTPETILRLVEKDPIVRTWFMLWQTGQLSWEECLIATIVEMSKTIEERANKDVSIISMHPIGSISAKTIKEFEEFMEARLKEAFG